MFSIVWSGAISNVFGPRDRVLALLNNLAVCYPEGHAMEQHISLEFSENHHEPCGKDCRAEDPYFDMCISQAPDNQLDAVEGSFSPSGDEHGDDLLQLQENYRQGTIRSCVVAARLVGNKSGWRQLKMLLTELMWSMSSCVRGAHFAAFPLARICTRV